MSNQQTETNVISTIVERFVASQSSLHDDELRRNLINDISREIKKHKQLYYAGTPSISDDSYDRLEDMMKQLDRDHPILSYVGYDSHGKIKHQFPMLSLEKTREYQGLCRWARRIMLPEGDSPSRRVLVSAAYKLDGISLSIIYAGGTLLLAKTRGDGTLGEDVTDCVIHLRSIPQRLPPTLTGNYEVRGELCCGRQDFQKLCQDMEQRGLNAPSSERNIVAGIMARKDHKDLAGYFSFFAFQIYDMDLRKDHAKLIDSCDQNQLHIAQMQDFQGKYPDYAESNSRWLKPVIDWLVDNNPKPSKNFVKSQLMRISEFQKESHKFRYLHQCGFTLPPKKNQRGQDGTDLSDPQAPKLFLSAGSEVTLTYLDGKLVEISFSRYSLAIEPEDNVTFLPYSLNHDGKRFYGELEIIGEWRAQTENKDNLGSVYHQMTKQHSNLSKLSLSEIVQDPGQLDIWLKKMFKQVNADESPLSKILALSFLQQLDFFAWDIDTPPEGPFFLAEQDKYTFFRDNSFAVTDDYIGFIDYLTEVQEYAKNGDYGIDGLVLTLEDTTHHPSLGYTSHHPRFRICFKWQGEEKASVLEQVIWDVSRTGLVTPVACIAPVEVSGAVIQRVSLHNYRYVKNMSLHIGDTVYVIRSGDVIPKITRIARGAETHALDFPTVCPECSHPLELIYEATKVDDGDSELPEVMAIRCPAKESCPPQIVGIISHWCRSVKIYDLSEKRIRFFVDHGIIRSLSDLYRLDSRTIANLPGFRDVIAKKIVRSIENSKQVSTVRFLVGLGITGLQTTMTEKITEKYPNVHHILALSAEDLAAIEGLAEKSAQIITQELAQRQNLIIELKQLGIKILQENQDRLAAITDLAEKSAQMVTEELYPPRIVGTVSYWCRHVNITDFSGKAIRHFVDRGMIRNISDLYRLDSQTIASFAEYSEATAQKIVDSIENSKNLTTVNFLVATSITGLSKTVAKRLAQQFTGIQEIIRLSPEDMLLIKGIPAKLAPTISQELAGKEQLVEELQSLGVQIA
ncbi:MAG: helix-hairpin-helix domain-containing protein [Proteobacteria bacterium]|nr:helix-hairpin-helix domain-containing protein [Pseudomonadota bacterium]